MPNAHTRSRRSALALFVAMLLSLPSPSVAMKPNASRVVPQGALSAPTSGVVLNPFTSAPAAAPRATTATTGDPLVSQIGEWIGEQLASGAGPAAARRAEAMDDEQRRAFEALRRRAAGEPKLSLKRGTRVPREIKGRSLQRPIAAEPGRTRAVSTARAFLRENRALLRLEDPDLELSARSERRDSLGHSHVRFRQYYAGLEVWPGELVVHLDRSGAVDGMSSSHASTPARLDTTPRVTSGEAIARARGAVPNSEGASVDAPRLLIYAPQDGSTRLAWKLRIDVSLVSQWVVLVDALDAAILMAWNDVHSMHVQGSGIDLQGNLQSFATWLEAGSHFLVDTTKVMFDPSSDPPNPPTTRGAIIVQDAQNQPTNNNIQTLPPLASVASVAATGPWLADGVSALTNLSAVYDYFLDVHGRNSLDANGASLLAAVRVGVNLNNAFFLNDTNLMVFGDGDTWAGALDMVAHEMTHGVTFHSANLIYQGQSGALNESFSDIFGEAVEARALGDNDWLVGTNLSPPLRNMEDPSSFFIGPGLPYPERMSEFIVTQEDNGGVHFNSSIINHAFYQLAEGLPGSISLLDAHRIFYRALTVHLTRFSEFEDARLACITSAEELFGVSSDQAQRTAEAFDVVEIFDGPGTPDPPDFPGTEGDDATLFVFADPDPFGPFSQCQFTGSGRCLGRLEGPGDLPLGTPLSGFDVGFGKPAVSGDGSLAVFVNTANDLCLIPTDGSLFESCLGLPGTVSSVAISPDGNLFGFVLLDAFGSPDNFLRLIDLTAPPPNNALTFELVAPALDGGVLSTVLFADSMDFTADGQFLIYDALNVIPQSSGFPITAWSIYAIDTSTGATLSLVPPVPGLDIGSPSLSQTSDNFLTFDVIDPFTASSRIFAGNLNTGQLAFIGQTLRFGAPGYNGDDTAIIYAQNAFTLTGFGLVEQPVGADRITPSDFPFVHLGNGDFGVIYRRGEFVPEPGANGLRLAALLLLGVLVRWRRRASARQGWPSTG